MFFWKNYGLKRSDGAKWTLDDELTLDEFGGLAHILLLFSAIFHSERCGAFENGFPVSPSSTENAPHGRAE